MTLDGPDAPRPVLAHLTDETNGGATSSTLASIVARARRHRERRLGIITVDDVLEMAIPKKLASAGPRYTRRVNGIISSRGSA
jgi:hypothetical protein